MLSQRWANELHQSQKGSTVPQRSMRQRDRSDMRFLESEPSLTPELLEAKPLTLLSQLLEAHQNHPLHLNDLWPTF